MDPIVIDETTLNTTHQNFIEFQPVADRLTEVLCFQHVPFPIDTFDIFRGIVNEDSSTVAIVLNPPVTKVSVVDGIITDYRPAIPDDGMVILHEDDYNNIYWKYHTPPMHLPKRKQEYVSETIKKPTPKPERTAEQAVRTLEFGGKTKRRNSRKSTKKNVKKRLL